MEYFDWIEREAYQAEMERKIQRHDMATPSEILSQIGWDREDRRFFSLNLTDEQWNVFLDAAQVAGDATAEEMITEALQEWMSGRGTGERKL